jgi:hypothetical protein
MTNMNFLWLEWDVNLKVVLEEQEQNNEDCDRQYSIVGGRSQDYVSTPRELPSLIGRGLLFRKAMSA